MSPHSAYLALGLVEIYGAVGTAVAVVFAIGLGRFDPSAKGAYAFRALLLPGLAALWPYVIWKLVLRETDQDLQS